MKIKELMEEISKNKIKCLKLKWEIESLVIKIIIRALTKDHL